MQAPVRGVQKPAGEAGTGRVRRREALEDGELEVEGRGRGRVVMFVLGAGEGSLFRMC